MTQFKVTGPGRYMSRGMRPATVRRATAEDTMWWRTHPWWVTPDSGGGYSVREDGGFSFAELGDPLDLIRRIDAPAKPRKAAQWGVWVPCKNRREARFVAESWCPVFIDCKARKPTVRRIGGAK